MQSRDEPGTVETVEETIEQGASIVKVGVRFEDGRLETASLRPDLVPEGLIAGDAVTVTRAALYHRWKIVKAS